MLPKERFVSQNSSVAFALEVRHGADPLCWGFMGGCLGAGYPHQGMKNVGFAPWLLKRVMVVPARKTAVLEEPLIFPFNTPFCDCHVEITPRCCSVIPAVGASDAQPLAPLGLWLCAPLCSEKGSLWEQTFLPCRTSQPQADSRFPYSRMKDEYGLNLLLLQLGR